LKRKVRNKKKEPEKEPEKGAGKRARTRCSGSPIAEKDQEDAALLSETVTVSNPIRNIDPDDESVTYSSSGLPEGLAINPRTGVISGTIDLRPARPTEEGSPGRDEDVKPDILIDPPQPDPDEPQQPPGSADQ
jgi:putative Ig domain-containing protein